MIIFVTTIIGVLIMSISLSNTTIAGDKLVSYMLKTSASNTELFTAIEKKYLNECILKAKPILLDLLNLSINTTAMTIYQALDIDKLKAEPDLFTGVAAIAACLTYSEVDVIQLVDMIDIYLLNKNLNTIFIPNVHDPITLLEARISADKDTFKYFLAVKKNLLKIKADGKSDEIKRVIENTFLNVTNGLTLLVSPINSVIMTLVYAIWYIRD